MDCFAWAMSSTQYDVFLFEALVISAMFIGKGVQPLHALDAAQPSSGTSFCTHPTGKPCCGRPRISVEQLQMEYKWLSKSHPICYCIMKFGPVIAQGHRHVALLLTPEFRNMNGSLDLSELLWLGCRRPNASSTKTPRSLMTPVCIEAVFCSLIQSAIYALSYAHDLLALNITEQLASAR